MIDAQPRCQNPSCGLPIAIIPGHRRRQYCNDACRMAAHRARIIAENQARYEALELQLALHERDEGRKSLAEERAALIDETMLAPSVFCGSASIELLRQARDAAHLKLQVKRGRLKLAELGSNRHATGG